jgi:hypothetical protein
MYSVWDTLAGGFPHSEISGSQVICHLSEAYRRLSRLSSPIIAKASSTCSYSLDPITLTFLIETPNKSSKRLKHLIFTRYICRNSSRYSLRLLTNKLANDFENIHVNYQNTLTDLSAVEFVIDAIKKLFAARSRCSKANEFPQTALISTL